MEVKFCKDRYKLYLSWDKMNLISPGVCDLAGAKFSGPVLHIAEPVKEHDRVDLDFTPEGSGIHIARLTWWGAKISDREILFEKCIIATLREEVVMELQSGHKILIDTSGHDGKKHACNLVYPAYFIKSDEK